MDITTIIIIAVALQAAVAAVAIYFRRQHTKAVCRLRRNARIDNVGTGITLGALGVRVACHVIERRRARRWWRRKKRGIFA